MVLNQPFSPEVLSIEQQTDMLVLHFGYKEAYKTAIKHMEQADDEDVYLYWHDVASLVH